MADPDTAHGFVYTEEGYIDIDASLYFTPTAGVDYTVGGYIDRVYFQLAEALELRLGVHNRTPPDYADFPLHLSDVALQTLYRQQHISGPSTSSASSSDIQSAASAEVPPVPPPGGSSTPRYSQLIGFTVALAITCRLVLLKFR